MLALMCMVVGAAMGDTLDDVPWVGQFASEPHGSSEVRVLARGPSDDLYAVVSFHGTVDADPGPASLPVTSLSATTDLLVCRMSASGALVWARPIGGTGGILAHAAGCGSDGAVYVAGAFTGTVDFDPGSGTHTMTSAGSYDIFLCKLSDQGEFLWATRIGGTSSDVCYGMAVDGLGHLYMTGAFAGSVDFDPGPGVATFPNPSVRDAYLLKLDSAGGFLWVRRLPDTGEGRGVSVTANDNGTVTWVGYCEGNATAEPSGSALPGYGELDLFALCYERNGDLVWARRMGGAQRDVPWSMCPAPESSVIITGQFTGTADFDPGPETHTLIAAGTGTTDVFVVKLNHSGELDWARRFGGADHDVGYGVASNIHGHAWVVGTYSATANLDDWPSDKALTSGGNSDYFVLRFDQTGEPVSLQGAGGTQQDLARAVVASDEGSVYLGGFFWGHADVLPGAPMYELSAAGDNDGFVVGLAPSLNVALSTTSRNPTSEASIRVSAVFSAPVSGFALEDITVTNGTASDLSGSGATYQFTVVPAGQGFVIIRIPAMVAHAATGDGNTGSAPLVRFFDTDLPNTSIHSEAPAIGKATPILVTVRFTEPVVDFSQERLQLVNGTIKDLSGEGMEFQFLLTPASEGPYGVEVPAGAAHDEAGNPCTAATLSRMCDTTPPTITVSPPSSAITAAGPVTYKVTVTGARSISLDASRVRLESEGTASGEVSVDGTGDSCTVTVHSIRGDGALGIVIEAGVAVDEAGNASLALESVGRFLVDNTPPSVVVRAPSPTLTGVGPVRFHVEYGSATAITLGSSDVELLSTGTAAGTLRIAGTQSNARDVIVEAITGEGTLAIRLRAGTACDEAGNLAPASGVSQAAKVSPDAIVTVPAASAAVTLVAVLLAAMSVLRRSTPRQRA